MWPFNLNHSYNNFLCHICLTTRSNTLLVSTAPRPTLQPTQPRIPSVPEALPPWVRRPGHEAEPSHPCQAQERVQLYLHYLICLQDLHNSTFTLFISTVFQRYSYFRPVSEFVHDFKDLPSFTSFLFGILKSNFVTCHSSSLPFSVLICRCSPFFALWKIQRILS